MKSQKQITLDIDLIERLAKEPNASALINKLLIEYYEKQDNPFKEMSKEQFELEQKRIAILKEAERQVNELDNGKGLKFVIRAV